MAVTSISMVVEVRDMVRRSSKTALRATSAEDDIRAVGRCEVCSFVVNADMQMRARVPITLSTLDERATWSATWPYHQA